MRKSKFNQPEPEAEPEFQVAPMADMLFVLLVFFMSITTTEVMQMQIDKLELPYAAETAEEEEGESQRNDIIINVVWDPDSRQADILYQGVAYRFPEELVAPVKAQLELNPLARVLIRADVDTEFDFVSQIMRTIGQAGVGQVSFGVITGGEGPGQQVAAPTGS
ncbi:MAG: biopolymer transporter ExbD [Verrucomicrobiota bacterium]